LLLVFNIYYCVAVLIDDNTGLAQPFICLLNNKKTEKCRKNQNWSERSPQQE